MFNCLAKLIQLIQNMQLHMVYMNYLNSCFRIISCGIPDVVSCDNVL